MNRQAQYSKKTFLSTFFVIGDHVSNEMEINQILNNSVGKNLIKQHYLQ